MPLLNISGEIIDDDVWCSKIDDENLPLDGAHNVIVDYDFLLKNIEQCQHHFSHGGRLGVAVANHADLDALDPYLPMITLIVIDFPRFSDGRGFSQATKIKRKNFYGILRAKGWLLPDQKGFLLQCGFDEIELDDNIYMRHGSENWQATSPVKLGYQRGYDKTHEPHPNQTQSILAKRWQKS